jgi:hypothetical protein
VVDIEMAAFATAVVPLEKIIFTGKEFRATCSLAEALYVIAMVATSKYTCSGMVGGFVLSSICVGMLHHRFNGISAS